MPHSGAYRGQIVADDEWCPDCGESLPCQCDDYYDEDNVDGDYEEELSTQEKPE